MNTYALACRLINPPLCNQTFPFATCVIGTSISVFWGPPGELVVSLRLHLHEFNNIHNLKFGYSLPSSLTCKIQWTARWPYFWYVKCDFIFIFLQNHNKYDLHFPAKPAFSIIYCPGILMAYLKCQVPSNSELILYWKTIPLNWQESFSVRSDVMPLCHIAINFLNSKFCSLFLGCCMPNKIVLMFILRHCGGMLLLTESTLSNAVISMVLASKWSKSKA